MNDIKLKTALHLRKYIIEIWFGAASHSNADSITNMLVEDTCVVECVNTFENIDNNTNTFIHSSILCP